MKRLCEWWPGPGMHCWRDGILASGGGMTYVLTLKDRSPACAFAVTAQRREVNTPLISNAIQDLAAKRFPA
jgi:hypothetical protein